MKKNKNRLYKWLPDLPDKRDYVYKLQKLAAPLPDKVDLRQFCSKVEDQSDLGSCTANAIVGALEYLENKNNQSFLDLSRLFVYYNERLLEGTIKQDSGAFLRDGIKTLVKYGVCNELLWPYNINKFKRKPLIKCYKDGLKHVISNYQRLNTLDDMKNCLASGYPFVFGFTVYESFESQGVAVTGIVNLPTVGEKVLGGHAVLCVGYDNNTERFLCRNSWGENWGIMNGHFTMPYEYLTDRNLSDDFWMINQ